MTRTDSAPSVGTEPTKRTQETSGSNLFLSLTLGLNCVKIVAHARRSQFIERESERFDLSKLYFDDSAHSTGL